jgi:hypothetical protein
MCDGEKARDWLSRDTLRLGLMVTDVDIATADVASEARTAFGAAFADVVAQTLSLSPDDIVIDTVTVARSTGTLRRWLQDLVDATVSFTITVDSDITPVLLARIQELRNTSATTIKVGDASTADTSTFTQPTVIAHDEPAGIECREGHDPDSPLCHVCLDGAQKHTPPFPPTGRVPVQHRLRHRWLGLANWGHIRLDGRRRPELHRVRDGIGRLGEGGRPGRRSRSGLSAFGRGVLLLPKDGGTGRQEGRGNSPVRAPRFIQPLWQDCGQRSARVAKTITLKPKLISLKPKIPLKPNGHLEHSMCRWVKPNFVSGGAVPLSIYGKVRNSSAT